MQEDRKIPQSGNRILRVGPNNEFGRSVEDFQEITGDHVIRDANGSAEAAWPSDGVPS